MGKLKSGDKVLLIFNRCCENGCTDNLPCENCLRMCNIAILKEDVEIEVIGGYDYLTDISKEMKRGAKVGEKLKRYLGDKC